MTEDITVNIYFRPHGREEAERIVRVLGNGEETNRFRILLRVTDDEVTAEIKAKDVVGARTAVNSLLRNYKLICDLKNL